MRIGKYEIVSELGEGGMGQVYKARDTAFQDGYVALKVLRSELSQNAEMRKRFFDEAQKARGVSHPNIVKIFDCGNADGLLYIAMEYIEGEDLGDRLKRECRIAPDEAVRIVIEVAIALEESHERGVIHRDIKPGNILIDKKGHVYVTIFGIEKTVGHDPEGIMREVSLYISPEYHMGEPLDRRSDIYSLGVMLYEMLTGDVPFHAEWTPAATAIKRMTQEPEPPRNRNGQIPGWLNSVVMRLLAKDPGRRFQSCGELVEALREKITVSIPRPPRCSIKNHQGGVKIEMNGKGFNLSPFGSGIIKETLHQGAMFDVYRASLNGNDVCLKTPAKPYVSTSTKLHQLRYTGVDTSIYHGEIGLKHYDKYGDDYLALKMVPVAEAHVEANCLLLAEAQIINWTNSAWNHEIIGFGTWDGLSNCHFHPCERLKDDILAPGTHDVRFLPVLIMPFYDSIPFSLLKPKNKRELFPRILPSLWLALCKMYHGDISESNILITVHSLYKIQVIVISRFKLEISSFIKPQPS